MDFRIAGVARILVASLALLAASPAIAAAQSGAGTPGSTAPRPSVSPGQPETPEGYNLSARQAIRIADQDLNVRKETEENGRLNASAEAKPPTTWQVGYFANDTEVAQVLVDDPTATVRESWTGYQVAWQMARGYEGQFGHKLNAPYVWIALAALFFFGLLDWRRPWRIVHLDLLVLLSFGVSQAFFNDANIGVSVPLAYPPLLYLLGRMLWVGFRGLARGGGLRPSAPIAWLAIATAFLLGFRIALNVADSGVIDVGYAGVIGADHVEHGQTVWGADAFPTDNSFGDTYGPANYYAYIPFEAAFPWHGTWDELPSGHAAAIFFDLATAVGLFFVGRRLRAGPAGNGLGAMLAFAWASYPYSDFALQSNSNDSLIAALLVWALVFFASPIKRGILLAVSVMAKFATLPLAPLWATGERGLSSRPSLRPALAFSGAFAIAGVLLLALPALDPGLATFWDRTVSSQINRDSPFSVWGQADLDWLHTLVEALVVGLAILVAFAPRRRSLPQIAALAAAVIIGVELTAQHWFYLYIPWFFPLLIIALAVSREGEPVEATDPHRRTADYGLRTTVPD